MIGRKLALLAAAGAFCALPVAPAEATVCGGVLSTHCADSTSLIGHTHSCITSGTNRVCTVHWHASGTCNGTTSGTCSVSLSTSHGSASGSCSYAALSNCSVSVSTSTYTHTFPANTGTKTSCGSVTTTANGGLLGTATEIQGTNCFTYF